MQNTPLTTPEVSVVLYLLTEIESCLEPNSTGQYDAGDRVVVQLTKQELATLRRAIKKL